MLIISVELFSKGRSLELLIKESSGSPLLSLLPEHDLPEGISSLSSFKPVSSSDSRGNKIPLFFWINE
jgi:hypothetical protein